MCCHRANEKLIADASGVNAALQIIYENIFLGRTFKLVQFVKVFV